MPRTARNAPGGLVYHVLNRRSCRRGAPYGSVDWVKKTAKKLGLESTLRSPGRPNKA